MEADGGCSPSTWRRRRPWGNDRRRSAEAVRVGLYGLLGAGNIGNDASMEVVLRYLRQARPGVVVDVMGKSPEELAARYDVEAVDIHWRHRHARRTDEGRARRGSAGEGPRLPGAAAMVAMVLGLFVDAVRTARWVRRHDAVVVPGAGVLEASLPLRPWETPYHLWLVGLAGRAFGTPVALVSVGATAIRQPVTRWLCDAAARLATYRSYRDLASRQVMAQRGIDVSSDAVYPDLVWGLPLVRNGPGDGCTVGVGVMTYYGTNDDRHRAAHVHAAYLEGMTGFVGRLVDRGYRVRLFVGDESDAAAVDHIVAAVQAGRGRRVDGWLQAAPAATFDELARAMAPVGLVVATRFHNVMCALKLGKPVISVGYSAKNEAVMRAMGMAEFCRSANAFDADGLTDLFVELERRAEGLRPQIGARVEEQAQLVDRQWPVLSSTLFGQHDVERSAGPRWSAAH